MTVRILTGDCRALLKTLPDASVHTCVTSPPYFGLRDYGTAQWEGGDSGCDHKPTLIRTEMFRNEAGDAFRNSKRYRDHEANAMPSRQCKCGARRIDAQMGLEATPDEWIAGMVVVFREVRRILRPDGTLWLNVGDSYSVGVGMARGQPYQRHAPQKSGLWAGTPKAKRDVGNNGVVHDGTGQKPKDLLMMPARLALALQADGWWLRSDIIWAKPNPMPESVTDRPTSAHEHIFLLSRSPRYYYDADAIREPHARQWDETNGGNLKVGGIRPVGADQQYVHGGDYPLPNPAGRNARNVWTIATEAFPEAHFATFPTELAERCIKAGTSERGCCATCGAPWVREVERETVREHASTREMAKTPLNVVRAGWREGGPQSITAGWSPSCQCNAPTVPATVLDPFAGAGTTCLVADRLQRHAIGIELNPAYAAMARNRITRDAGLFAEVAD